MEIIGGNELEYIIKYKGHWSNAFFGLAEKDKESLALLDLSKQFLSQHVNKIIKINDCEPGFNNDLFMIPK